MNFFPGQGKVREFCGWSGKFRKDFESQGKVQEFESKWLWQADFRKFMYSVQEGKRCTFSLDSLRAHLPPHWELLLKERICSLGEQILSFKSNFQILSDTVSTIKLKNKKHFFFICQRIWKTAKCQGKIREKSGSFEVDDKWQP